jgi:hypothetical protein
MRQTYAWELTAHIDELVPGLMPRWLLTLVTAPGRSMLPRDGTPLVLREGERNDRIFRLACGARRYGLSQHAILEYVESINRHHCEPPLEAEELTRIAASAGRYTPAHADELGAVVAEAIAERTPAIRPSEEVPWPDDGDAPPLSSSASDRRDAAPGRVRDHQGDGGSDGTMADVRGPWARAVPAADFLASDDPTLDWLIPRVLAPGSLTNFFSPRGLGKTHIAYAYAVAIARLGRAVLLLDRDNSKREIRRRLRAWGASDLTTLKVMTRDDVPPLTDTAKWATFPWKTYDLVIVDSLDASTEGVGERDSAKPAKAIAPLLDIAHRAEGPAILVLGNTIKSAEHSRGSGVVEDRADIVYEVRDATEFSPSGKRDWWLELPRADAGGWGERSARRKRREKYRLAFVCSKYRLGEEPEPFCIELDTTTDPWSVRDVTEQVIAAGTEAIAALASKRAADLEAAAKALCEAVRAAPEFRPLLADKDAVPFLMEKGIKRTAARQLLRDRDKTLWRLVQLTHRKGKPTALRPVNAKDSAEIVPERGTQSSTPLFEKAFPPDQESHGGGNDVGRKPSSNEHESAKAFPPPDKIRDGGNTPPRESSGDKDFHAGGLFPPAHSESPSDQEPGEDDVPF